MAIKKDKETLYRDRIIEGIKGDGKLPMSRIADLTRMNTYNAHFMLAKMLDEGIIKKIDGVIVLYDLVEER